MLTSIRDFGPKKDMLLTLTLATITGNQCQNVPEITLVYGRVIDLSDIATYLLSSEAYAKWKFRWPNPVSAKNPADADSLAHLEIKSLPGQRGIVLRLKPGATAFTGIDMLLHFVSRSRTNPGETLALDPSVKSGGGPRV